MHNLGWYGVRLYELARGIDNSEVVPDRPTQSISAEDTFEQGVLIRRLAEHTWVASRKESRIARTVVLKLKTSEFKLGLKWKCLWLGGGLGTIGLDGFAGLTGPGVLLNARSAMAAVMPCAG